MNINNRKAFIILKRYFFIIIKFTNIRKMTIIDNGKSFYVYKIIHKIAIHGKI
ncbi:hypothetical protein SDC9_107265 [bioreactor metagenome]|uniref:Uncharacterized protein n=1 Tax=bioreactor metagenome TaxID=1076179 RepID=A0A645BFD0_9ZZZZ